MLRIGIRLTKVSFAWMFPLIGPSLDFGTFVSNYPFKIFERNPLSSGWLKCPFTSTGATSANALSSTLRCARMNPTPNARLAARRKWKS
jgi:hypothetical protein